MDFKQHLRTFIVNDLRPHEDLHDLSDTESLLDRGVIDSLGLLRLVAFLEGELRTKIPDADVVPEHFESIDAIADFVAQLRQGARPR
ncbi:MAG TPA: acyl carrier protein [Methylomirabilota bacterium]|nr:acyl carrier protein [Methylomirabilota bacterium]